MYGCYTQFVWKKGARGLGRRGNREGRMEGRGGVGEGGDVHHNKKKKQPRLYSS